MAIRVRRIGDELVALCAAKTEAEKDDIYLDDGVHYALACKFAREHKEQDGVGWNDELHDRLTESVEKEREIS